LDRQFQTREQIIFYIKFRTNSVKFPTSFSFSFPKVLTYIFLYSSKDIKKTARTRILPNC
jgi:hypothetical protein